MERPSQLDQQAIKAVLPHRPPFLFLDSVSAGNEDEVIAHRKIEAAEPWFEGHFPGRPVMPGVLLVETMAQALIVLYWFNFDVEHLYFLARDESRFHSPVFPGDEMRIVARKIRFRRRMGRGQAEIWIGDRLCAESVITYASSGEKASDLGSAEE